MARWKYDAERRGYSPVLVERICAALAEGRSLRSICKDKGMPTEQTTYRWLAKSAEFRALYSLAREVQVDVLVDEILDIADNASEDWIKKDSGWVTNRENIKRTKLRIGVRKWRVGILMLRKYGAGRERSGDGEVTPEIRVVREIVERVVKKQIEPQPKSGRQEQLENIVNRYV